MKEEVVAKQDLTAKDFASDQEVKWCPGCGDYSILKQTQSVLAELGHTTENTVFVSGIGCSSRFPYYMNTYGMHSLHGRATAVATGLKIACPELSVWIITGDGDSMSIGGNHLIHILRRNVDVNILLFNNEIYGLTKGQYSPTSPQGKVTKSSPLGSLDHPFNPGALAMGADATFVARAMDRDPKHMRDILKRADEHRGTSLVEIYQNCNVFNDGAFFPLTEKDTKADNTLFLEHSQPLVYANGTKGIKLNGFNPIVVDIAQGDSYEDLWIHDEADYIKATLLTRFFEAPDTEGALPRPFGVIYAKPREAYEKQFTDQIEKASELKGMGDLNKLLAGNNTWEIN